MKAIERILKLSFPILMIMSYNYSACQNITVNFGFDHDTIFYPFNSSVPIYGVRINGTYSLISDSSLIRVVLSDNDNNEYLIFESYPLIVESKEGAITGGCDETCYPEGIIPKSIRIDIINAEIFIDNIQLLDVRPINISALQEESIRIKDSLKVLYINSNLSQNKLFWRAGLNEIAKKTYQEKAQLFGTKYNLLGFEYYNRGIFEPLNRRNLVASTNSFVNSFDWRNRHGSNNSNSPYFDGDQSNEKSGWLTGIRDQGDFCGSCYVFAAIAAVEARTNIYYNTHDATTHSQYDIDLSEQQIISCPNPSLGGCNGGWPSNVLFWLTSNKVIDEECFPINLTSSTAIDCQLCSYVDEVRKVGIESMNSSNWNEEVIKSYLITTGPLAIVYGPMNHAMLLSGYYVNNSGQFLFNDGNTKIYLPNNSSLVGTTTWILKNSWGPDDNPYYYISCPATDIVNISKINGPLSMENFTLEVKCTDEDHDGYFWWGIGDKPSTCPSCPDERDCDDSDPNVGPYDGTYACSPICEFVSRDTVFTGTQTITGYHFFNRDVVIETGAEITINGTLAFVEQAKVIVKRGAKLVVGENGKLTSGCSGLWKGVEVWGNTLEDQTPANQGFLSISGGTIENAECGANISRLLGPNPDNSGPSPGPVPMNRYMGGIIQSDGGKFINNRIGVKFDPYNYNNQPNLSWFRYTEFKTTQILIDNSVPNYFVKMNGVRDIPFSACTFRNESPSGIYDTFDKGGGIYSYNSSFTIDTVKVMYSGEIIKSVFENLYRGIYALNSIATVPIVIDQNNFINVYRSLYISGFQRIGQAHITQNGIMLMNQGNSFDKAPYGIYLDRSSAFHVEANTISNVVPGVIQENSVGVIVNNSGQENNLLYNNVLKDLAYGVLAQNTNHRHERYSGLVIKCNDFYNCLQDISVTTSCPECEFQGISDYQGIDNELNDGPAGNAFSEFIPNHWDILNNDGADPFYYVYHSNYSSQFRIFPDYIQGHMTSVSSPVTYSKDNSCPSTLSKKDESEYNDLIEQSIVKYDSLVNTLQSLVDGGSTTDLKDYVETRLPEDAVDTRNELLIKSPFLSDTVMSEAIQKTDVIDNPMIRDILEANPQAAKNEELINSLEPRIMPDYLMADILEGETIFGAKEILESRIAVQSLQTTTNKNELLDYYARNKDHNSIFSILSEENTAEAIYNLASLLFSNKQYSDAFNILENIPANISQDYCEQIQLQNFSALISIAYQMEFDTMGVLLLDSVQVSELQNLSLMGGISGDFARNILIASGNVCYEEPIIFPTTFKSSSKSKYTGVKTPLKNNSLTIFPNPASEYITVLYSISDFHSENISVIEIWNSNGINLTTLRCKQPINQIIVPLEEYKPGTYFVSLRINGEIIDTKPLIIRK